MQRVSLLASLGLVLTTLVQGGNFDTSDMAIHMSRTSGGVLGRNHAYLRGNIIFGLSDGDEIKKDQNANLEKEEPAHETTLLHEMAANGDLEGVRMALKLNKSELSVQDFNLWQPLHEATRNGHLEVVKELVKGGASLDTVTLKGCTPLGWARKTHGDTHKVIGYLQDLDAPDFCHDIEL
jgi:hypothetical protein